MPKGAFLVPCLRCRGAARQLRGGPAGTRTTRRRARVRAAPSGPVADESYQRGAALLAFCRDKLQAVEQIKVLDAGSLKTWSAQ